MGGLSPLHLIVVAIVVLVLFGRGRISDMMGDFGKGIKSFKEGMADETNRPVVPPVSQIPQSPPVAPQVQPVQPPVVPVDHQGPTGGA